MSEEFKVTPENCINIKVTPVNNNVTDEFLNKFSDEPLKEDPELEEAKKKLNGFINYFKSDRFEKDVNKKAYKTGESPRVVAKNAVAKAFGVVGDILGIAVDTVNFTLNGLVELLANILHSGINLITRLVNGLCRIVTFNQTANAF